MIPNKDIQGGTIFAIGLLIIFLFIKSFFNNTKHRNVVVDKYETYEELQKALRKEGLEDCNLIVAIDCTRSNEWQGKESWDSHLSMHALPIDGRLNPYQQVLTICGKSLEVFDEDHQIPLLGFGDMTTKGRAYFEFNNGDPCYTFQGALQAYAHEIGHLELSGPTNFAPVIRKACDIAGRENSFHVLIIICDGQVTSKSETIRAIKFACNYPLSIVIIGVGDGDPEYGWSMMEDYDDGIPDREWDNVQFVPFDEAMQNCPPGHNPEVYFATRVLQEIPDHYKMVKKLNLIN